MWMLVAHTHEADLVAGCGGRGLVAWVGLGWVGLGPTRYGGMGRAHLEGGEVGGGGGVWRARTKCIRASVSRKARVSNGTPCFTSVVCHIAGLRGRADGVPDGIEAGHSGLRLSWWVGLGWDAFVRSEAGRLGT